MGLIAKIPRQYTNPESLELELYRAIIQLSKLVGQLNKLDAPVNVRHTDFGTIRYYAKQVALSFYPARFISIGDMKHGFELYFLYNDPERCEMHIPTSSEYCRILRRSTKCKLTKLINDYPGLPYKIFRMISEIENMINDVKEYLENKQSKR